MSDEEMAKFISGGNGWEEYLPIVAGWDDEKRSTYEFLMEMSIAVDFLDQYPRHACRRYDGGKDYVFP
jgi:hypothetical protein